MASPASHNDHLVFDEFLGHLRQYGFSIGVDHYLRLQELLDKISVDCAPTDLKTLLCPIFATDKNQQEQFYRAFDYYFSLFQPPNLERLTSERFEESSLIPPEEPKPIAARKWLYLLGAMLIVCLVFALALLITQKRSIESQGIENPAPDQTLSGTDQEDVNKIPVARPALTPAPSSDAGLSFYRRYGIAVRWTALLAPLIIFLFYEWYRFDRRRLILQKQRGNKPPYVWPIRVDAPSARLYSSDQFYDAARLMRRRQFDAFYRLDVNATVAATVESLGYTNFRYKLGSRPPEYLVLIDRASFRDHQAQLFNELIAALEQQAIFVARYFYDGDPRICCGEIGEGCLHLMELQNKYPGHRLLIFGNGEQIVDPITGKLSGWASVFSNWRDRALLTPERPAQWLLREIALASQFIVLPATVDGLIAMVNHFESPLNTESRHWLPNGSEIALPLENAQPGLVEALRNYLGEDTFQWLCACAVYPELQWDLTLYLGSLPCMGGDLIKEKNLLRLIRLPWFRRGSIPDDIRWLLIHELDWEKQRAIRLAIIELLEKNPPQKETFAADAYQLNLVVQRWLFSRDRKKRREMLRVMETIPQGQITRDHTLMRFLESAPNTLLDVVLPRQWRKYFYRNSISVFGMRTSVRFLITLLMIAVSAVFIKAPSPLKINGTSQSANELVKANTAPVKLYLDMTPEEQRKFVADEAQHMARMIGNREGFAFTDDVVSKIKIYVDAYAKRLNSPRPSGGCNMRHDLRTLLERGSRTAPIINRAFNEKGVPPQVGLYLAMIESEYCQCLSSGTGAKGMFQFFGTTARKYGAKDVSQSDTDPRPDDRCRLEIMAPIVAEYMKETINSSGIGPLSVPQAIAFYNGGIGDGEVLNEIRNSENPERSFWTLVANADRMSDQFQSESMKYVPKFFGAAIVGENPRVFGVEMQPLSFYTQYSTVDMVFIPGGTFQMGRNDGPVQDAPAHTATVQSFSMDKTEVTNAEYADFVRETDYQPPGDWVEGKPPTGQELFPVVNVSVDDAKAFAAWRSKRDGVTYRLPTEEEWEYAARGGDQGNLYSWGSNWVEGGANVGTGVARAVGSYREDKTRWGVLDMMGNVYEWTSSKASVYPGNPARIPPGYENYIVIRGGAYASEPQKVKRISATYRDWVPPTTRSQSLGFRLVRSDPY